MKKLLTMLLTAVILLQFGAIGALAAYISSPEGAEEFISDDFTVMAVGDPIPSGWTVSLSNEEQTTARYAKIAKNSNTGVINLGLDNGKSTPVTATRSISIPEGGGIITFSFNVCPRKTAGYQKKIQFSKGGVVGMDLVYDWLDGANKVYIKTADGVKTAVGLEN